MQATKAELYMDKFVTDLTYIEGDRLTLVKEFFDTLIAANCRELALKYIKAIDLKQQDWQPEDKNLYFALTLLKLGNLAFKNKQFEEALGDFSLGLEYMKLLEQQGAFSSPETSLKKKVFFDLLFNIANCCFLLREYDRAESYNKIVVSSHARLRTTQTTALIPSETATY